MLKDIRTIKIQGANFELSDELKIFNDSTQKQISKGTLIYGRNGSGKSTISRAFEKISEKREISNVTATVYDGLNNVVTLAEDEKKKIFVFNEDFINNNVKVEGKDNLQTIIMLGEVVELSGKIEKLKSDLEITKKQLEQQNKICEEYSDKTTEQSPFFYLEKMKDALKGNENWAGRYRRITFTNKQNASVNDETYKQFIDLQPEKTRDKLIVDFDTKFKELEKANEGTLEIEYVVPVLNEAYIKYDDIALQNILKEVIDKPDFTEREKRLLNMLEEGRGNRVEEQLTVFQDKKTVECPFCFRSINNEEKQSLVDSLKKVLSKKVEEHRNKLQKYYIPEVRINLEAYRKLDGYSDCSDLVNQINDILQRVRALIDKKFGNPYETVDEQFSISQIANKLNVALKALEDERIKYNKKACDIVPIKEELKKINDQIAHYDIDYFYRKYEACKKEQEKAESLDKEIKKQFDEMKEELNELESKKKNYRLACDFINDCLKYIFFADGRLSIKYQNDAYYILSYGKNVKPCDVSVGERNIIGLCYFFASIFNGQEEQEAYSKEYLLIVDDPISSYDWENRVGILSFLKFILGKFLKNNVDTKVIVMTHDILTFYDFTKIFEEIGKTFKSANSVGCSVVSLELKEKKLQTFEVRNRQEYSMLLQKIYDYSFGNGQQNQQDDFAIGNIMRQVLEAFSTFVYRKGIEEVSNDETILGLLKEKQYINYYENLMYRLVLNGGSHKEDQVKSMKDFNFFDLISTEQKKRTGKDILCFMYLLNEEHVLRHLKKDINQPTTNFEEQLKKHCETIKKLGSTS